MRHFFGIRLAFILFCLSLGFALPQSLWSMGTAPQQDNAAKNATANARNATDKPEKLEVRMGYNNLGGGRMALRMQFNKAMIDDAPLGQAIAPENLPIAISPAVAGEGKWADRNTLIFTSYEAMPKATTLKITFREDLADQSGVRLTQAPVSFTPFPFTYSANQVRYAKDGTVSIRLDMYAKVDPAKLKSALTVTPKAGGKALPFELEPAAGDRAGLQFMLQVKPEQFGELVIALPEGFTCEEGPQGIAKNEASRTVNATSMFAVRSVRPRQSDSPPWSRYIEVQTTNDVDIATIRQYLDITPETDVKVEARSGGFTINGDFITKPRVSLTFKKGMPGTLGLLAEDFKSTVVFNDFSPRLAFDTQGTILSPNRSMRVPLSTINVERVQATLWQLPESNIPLMSMGFFDGYKKHLSRKLAVRNGEINAVRNRAAVNSLDLAQIAGKAKGVFLLTVTDASDPKKVHSDEARDPEYDGYYDEDGEMASQVEKLVVISDIGITARVMPESLTVWVNSIATTDAIKNARVRVFAANNVLLAEGRTDNDGLWQYVRKSPWEGRERPALVLVSTAPEKGEAPKAEPGLAEPSVTDMAYLKLDANLAADSAFDTGGRPYLRAGYEAFCFTPRGIFRPGETVDFKVLVRDAQLNAPQPFPVAWTVTSSTGRTVGRGTAMLSPSGGASFALPLVPSSPTGKYFMSVTLPGQQRMLGFCSFAVEDFAPPRIEVKLSADQPYVVGDDSANITVDAKYLFGAPAADAPWESVVRVSPLSFSHPDWRSFTFPAGEASPSSSIQEDRGKLDDKGLVDITLTPDSEWKGSALNLTMTVRVREDGGRWVARNIAVPYYKSPVLLGYELPRQEPQAGTPYALRVAAVAPDGKPSTLKSVTAVAESIQDYYVRSDRGYTRSVKYTPVATSEVNLQNGTGVFSFTPPKRGEYRVRFLEAGGTAQSDVRLSVWAGLAGSEDGGSPLIDRVMLSWDKPKYTVGETAILKVRSPFPGKLLIVLEGEKEIYRQVLSLKGAETTVRVPVLNAMLPNAYASAWVIRPVKENETWGAHRAFGIIPLSVDQSAARLDIALSAPEQTLPKGEMPVSVLVKDSAGRPVQGEVTLAFVDEGLLSLTNFPTPDPLRHFTAKRGMQGMVFDLYDNLMPLSTKKPLTLHPAGGEGGQGSLLSPLSRRLELLSIFLGTVLTDAEGKGAAVLKLPEYSGKGRLMAVAVSPSGVGSASSQVRVARDLTVEATVPRMVAPGDSFTAPVLIFGDGEKAAKAVVSVLTEGPLTVSGPKEYRVSLDAKTPKVALSLPIKAGDAADMGALRIVTTIANSTDAPFEQRLEIPVRPPFPRLTKSGGGVVRAGESASIDVDGGFFAGTQKVTLSFSDSPAVSLVKALSYLGAYPYGCLEQTTSSAWPYLAVPQMLKNLDPEKAQDTEFKMALDFAIRRILSMQRPDGGFNYWPGPSRSDNAYAWGSVYAAHLLTEAKGTGLVPPDALKAALSWLRSFLAGSLPEKGDYEIMDALSAKAYITYVLALNGDAPLGWMQFLKDQGKFLSPSARIFLAGAYAVATGKSAPLKELGTQALPQADYCGWSLESSPRNEALRLLMWASVDPFAAETAELARRVMNDGDKDRWRSTQENGVAVLALGRYAEKTATKGKNYEAVLEGAAQPVSFTHGQNPVLTRKDLAPAEPAAPGPLKVSVTGEGATYYSWTTSGVPVIAPEPFSEGLFVGRRWVLPDGSVTDFMDVDKDGKAVSKARKLTIPQGSKVTVVLYVQPGAAMNSLVLADIVPGGFEIDNPSLVPDNDGDPAAGATLLDPKTKKPLAAPGPFKNALLLNRYAETRTEMRDDRLLLFVNSISSRPAAFVYTLRAVAKGTFVLPPVAAEAMYDPSVRALTAPGTVTVE